LRALYDSRYTTPDVDGAISGAGMFEGCDRTRISAALRRS
jgi:hypothetical protein